MLALSRTPSCLHQLIEDQARRTPGQTAVVFEGQRLSYGELDRRAGELADRLHEHGAGPEVRVALFMARSVSLMVGLLGILKAGAAYVPIDPAFPQARIAFIIEDAGARMVLTQRSLLPRLPAGAPRSFCIDDIELASRGAPVPAVEAPGPENLAYVIYTSGSTGRPKGVCIEHRNIVNYVLGVAERLQFSPGMHHAMVSTIAADLGNTVIFPALATGGCLHVISQERAENQGLLAEYFSREKIDILKIAPSHLAALQAGKNPEQVMPRRCLVLGGEPSALDRIEQLRAMATCRDIDNPCEIHNHYGPTEATVGVLTYRVGGLLPRTRTGTLPLGTPLPNSRVHVLEQDGRPAPVGEQGELFIGGAGVARGYLNRPDLTADKFVADPFNPEVGARLYRTGDLGRVLPDGSIEFCGRMDDQVKLGGHRVELGEIEQALHEHGGVREAVVLAREDGSGGKRLVAYVAPKLPGDERALAPASLRQHLNDRLPRHMVPQAFVLVETFPLMPNGKIDRLALPPAETVQPCADFVGPRTETEKSLAGIWSELLQVENIGVNDDFFDLGGKSLHAIRMVARIRDTLGVDVQLRNLFERPTVAGFAEIVDGLAWARKSEFAPAGADEREELTL